MPSWCKLAKVLGPEYEMQMNTVQRYAQLLEYTDIPAGSSTSRGSKYNMRDVTSDATCGRADIRSNRYHTYLDPVIF
jgi:hypothetical protein